MSSHVLLNIHNKFSEACLSLPDEHPLCNGMVESIKIPAEQIIARRLCVNYVQASPGVTNCNDQRRGLPIMFLAHNCSEQKQLT